MEPFSYVAARQPVLLLVPALMLAEMLWHRLHGGPGYDPKETATSTAILVGQLAMRAVTAVVLAPVILLVHEHRLADVPLNGATVALLFLGMEFLYYWFHRASHSVRWLWATHAVHHSSTRLNFSAAYRLGWTGLLSAGWLFFLPLVWIGFDPRAVFGLLGLNLSYQFFLHTEMVGRLGPLEAVLNTPAHHRAHHAVNATCRDRNFGGVLIVFDRLFGTIARPQAGETLSYGLDGRRPSHNPVVVALREWALMARDIRRAKGLKGRVRAAFGPP
jgi:sterol desaturase/sphingolipid hydroxylase (fatty acid hydroxylase superfamily)